MPTYEYHCENCHHTMEAFQKISDKSLELCPKCNKNTLRRGPGGGVGLIFKGSGFYITDYPNKSHEHGKLNKDKDKKQDEVKKDSPKDDSKGSCGGGCSCH